MKSSMDTSTGIPQITPLFHLFASPTQLETASPTGSSQETFEASPPNSVSVQTTDDKTPRVTMCWLNLKLWWWSDISARCKRGFSEQNRILSKGQSSLNVTILEELVKISTEGPSFEQFDPEAYKRSRPNYIGWPSDTDMMVVRDMDSWMKRKN